jgi:hypothetical protein
MYRAAFQDFNLLRFIEHAFWLLASHGIRPSGPFPLVCEACMKPWPCPEITWAADWTLTAKQLGLLEKFGLQVGEDIMAILASWGRDGTQLHPQTAVLVGAGHGHG